MGNSDVLKIGTRGSALARWQASWVAEELSRHGFATELVPISTQGDQQQAGPIGQIGTQGVFTKELQRALLQGDIDLSVHSLKDLPTEHVAGLTLAAVPLRETVDDALISRDGLSFEALPSGAVIGTGSLRRQSQLLYARPDLRMQDIRGNVDTRLKKLSDGQYDAIVLAVAGLKRLGLADQITQILPRSLILPAVGQGALGLETREGDARVIEAVAVLNHAESHAAVLAERSMLATLRGGCLAPIAAWARIEESDQLQLDGIVLDRSGNKRLFAAMKRSMGNAVALGEQVAAQLIEKGAPKLIAQLREA